jgi:NADH-quinone oxidoreductase subunit M
MILSALYLLWAYQRVFHGPLEREDNRAMPDMSVREWLAAVPLVVMALLIGVWPRPFLDRMGPSLELVRQRVVSAQTHVSTAGSIDSTGGR